MRKNIIRTLFKKELLELFRDKKTVIVMLVIPILIYPIMGIMMMNIASMIASSEEDATWYLSANRIDPALMEIIDGQSDQVNLLPGTDDPREAVDTGLADAALLREELDGRIRYKVYYRSADPESSNLTSVLRDSIEQYGRQLSEERIRAAGLSPEEALDPVTIEREDLSSEMDVMGFALGGSMPMLLLILVMTGAFYPAVDMTSGEKERGTMELLLTMPITSLEMIMGKFLAVAMIAIASAVMNILGIGMFIMSMGQMLETLGEEGGGIDFVSLLPAVGIMLLCVIAFALFISAVIMCVCAFAKSYKEANNYITPMMFVVMFASMICFAPQIRLTETTALIPAVNVALLIKDAMQFRFEWLPIILVFLSNAIYAFAAIYILSRIYTSESVLFSEGGATVKFFESRKNLKSGNLPTIQEAVFLMMVILVISFYAGSALGMRNGTAALVLQQAVYAGLPLAACWYIKGDFKTVFSLRMPDVRGVLAAVLLGIGTPCLTQLIVLRLAELMPKSLQNVEVTFHSLLDGKPFPVVFLMIAVLPAVCEEVLFRGYILCAAREKWKMRAAVLVTAVLFAAFHMSLIRFLPILVLGTLMTYAAYATGSIVTSVIVHFLNNGVGVLLMFYGDRIPGISGDTYSLPLQGVMLAIGIVTVAVSLLLLRRHTAE